MDRRLVKLLRCPLLFRFFSVPTPRNLLAIRLLLPPVGCGPELIVNLKINLLGATLLGQIGKLAKKDWAIGITGLGIFIFVISIFLVVAHKRTWLAPLGLILFGSSNLNSKFCSFRFRSVRMWFRIRNDWFHVYLFDFKGVQRDLRWCDGVEDGNKCIELET